MLQELIYFHYTLKKEIVYLKKKNRKARNRRDSGTPRVEDLFRREPQDSIEFSRFRSSEKKKKKKKLIFLSYKTKFNIRRGTLSLLLLFFSLSFAIVSFPLGFLYLSSLCYSHSPSVTSNLKLFFLFLSLYLPLSSF